VSKEAKMISVLIVVDNLAEIRLFEEIFAEFRLFNHLDWAMDGEEALGFIEANRPDLVLLDTLLPKIDGFEVLAKIKSNRDLDSVKVIMMSGSFDQDDYIKERAPNSDGYMSQPITLEWLAAKISSLDHFAVAVVRW
jgi:CheY-like chemotaxis protein